MDDVFDIFDNEKSKIHDFMTLLNNRFTSIKFIITKGIAVRNELLKNSVDIVIRNKTVSLRINDFSTNEYRETKFLSLRYNHFREDVEISRYRGFI